MAMAGGGGRLLAHAMSSRGSGPERWPCGQQPMQKKKKKKKKKKKRKKKTDNRKIQEKGNQGKQQTEESVRVRTPVPMDDMLPAQQQQQQQQTKTKMKPQRSSLALSMFQAPGH